MPIYHYDLDQYSEKWERLRLGIPTASQFSKIISPSGNESKQIHDYAHQLMAERILKRRIDAGMSQWMERGHKLEDQAVEFYECQRDIETQKVGFITTDDGLVGASPDCLIGNDGMVEIKCPAPQTQVKHLVEGKLDDKYKPQAQGQLFVSGREWVDIVSYHPELPPCILRVYRDEVYCRILEKKLSEFVDYMIEGMQLIAKRLGDIKTLPETPDALQQLIEG